MIPVKLFVLGTVCLFFIVPLSAMAGNNSGAAFSTWPDTGQTTFYSSRHGVIACPAEGQRFHGQDAQYAQARSYTKLDGNGNALPATATSWVMVRDNVTDLVWEANQNNAETYTWCDPNPATNGDDEGTCGIDDSDTQYYIDTLNNDNFGGYSDWRMPTMKDLATLSDFSRYAGAIDPSFFPRTKWDFYWTSTSNSYSIPSSRAWYIDFYTGTGYGNGTPLKSSSYYVRAVRGGQESTSTQFTDNGDGTVTDIVTSLMWQQDTMDIDNDKTADVMIWEHALAQCEDLILSGHADWRLPNINELISIVDYEDWPSIDTSVFPDTSFSTSYWSSTTHAYYVGNAWEINLAYGGYGSGTSLTYDT